MKKRSFSRLMSSALVLLLIASMFSGINLTAFAEDMKPASPTLVIDMLDEQGTILHGASSFLYGVSSEGVPTNDLLTPLKSKVLATKGAVGTEHPYGDALDVAKSFLESGGEQVQMYNSNYYAIFQPKNRYQEYVVELENVICPAVVEWKRKWKEEHHADPVTGIDDMGLDIDKAIVYVPINERDPIRTTWTGGGDINTSFKAYYDVIKKVDPKAMVAGPNDALYGNWAGFNNMRNFLKYCSDNNCWPDVVTWHQLDLSDSRFAQYPQEYAHYRSVCAELGRPESQIVINEYAANTDCGVPGRLVNWLGRFEDSQVYACLPFWHQADNLNDLAADANEPNGAWWLYKWYGDMSGNRVKITQKNTNLIDLYGLSAIDDSKKASTTLFGGVDGSAIITLKDLNKTETFNGAEKVNVKIDATYFKGFNSLTEPSTILEGTFALDNGNLIMEMEDMQFATAYRLTVTPAKDEDEVMNPLLSAFHGIYEAETAARTGTLNEVTSGKYYLSGRKAVNNFSTTRGIDYKINVPTDGRYKLEFVYGNDLGQARTNETTHKPTNEIQRLSIDTDAATYTPMILKNTMEKEWTAIYTKYVDLTAGEHTISIRGNSTGTVGNIMQDALHVTYAGVYEQELPAFNTVYEAETADFDFNALNPGVNPVEIKTELPGYTGNGYVTGLSAKKVADGGGIRWNVVVEDSGLYNFSLRYQSAAAGTADVYIGNAARTFEGFKKSVNITATAGDWGTAEATIYLQKGVNIVDLDASADIALDGLRVKKSENAESLSQAINAVNAIPAGAKMTDVEYNFWSARWNENYISPMSPVLNGCEPFISEVRKVNKKTTTTNSPTGTEIEYVVGRSLTGDPNAANDKDKYLEFSVSVPTAGTYAMQVFHSNDEIFGTHGYNTKIIDKFACIKVNDDPAKRYFFINTISRDTFKEKSVYVDLKAGENKIKVFNDDSWTVLKGLDDSWARTAGLPDYRAAFSTPTGNYSSYYFDKPGNIPIVNSLPNLSKFIITPASLASPLAAVNEHKVVIRTSSGGTAVADKNTVLNGESVTFTITAQTALANVLVNGESKMGTLVDKGNDVYELTVSNVKEDVELQVTFGAAGADENDPTSPIKNNSFGTGDLSSWDVTTNYGESAVETTAYNRYDGLHYLKLSGKEDYITTVSQKVTMTEGGLYKLNFVMKNLDGLTTSPIGKFNSVVLSASVDDELYLYKMLIAPSVNYQPMEGLVSIPEGGATLDINITVDAKAGFEAFLDAFTLKKTERATNPLAYYVVCGANNPSVMAAGQAGQYQSRSEQIFGVDPVTGRKWGVYDYGDLIGTGGGTNAIFTTFTEKRGEGSHPQFRTNRGNMTSGGGNGGPVGEMYNDYKFELTPGKEYGIEIGTNNIWNNSRDLVFSINKGPTSTEAGDNFKVLERIPGSPVPISTSAVRVVTGTGYPASDGILTVCLRSTNRNDNYLKLNYIKITQDTTPPDPEELRATLSGLLSRAVDKTKLWPSKEKAIANTIIGFGQSLLDGNCVDDIRLENAIDALEKLLNLDVTPMDPLEVAIESLKALVESVKDLNEGDYTSESWATLQEALNNAIAILEDKEATLDDVENALTELEKAIEALEGYVAVTSVKVDGAAIQQVRMRNTKQFSATVNPSDATDQLVTWESSNEKIFTVKDGLVTGLSTGSAKLIVTCGGKTSFIMVQVTA